MAININVQVARAVPSLNAEGLTLAIFKTARRNDELTEEVVELNSLQDLYDSFEINDATALTEAQSAYELHVAEYLIRAGVNLLGYATVAAGTIASADVTTISDVEVFGYKMITVPYAFITDAAVEAPLTAFAKANDVQLFLDLDPTLDADDVEDAITAIGSTGRSPKLELFFNTGLTNFTSNFDVPAEFDATLDVPFFGIPASAAAIARKASLLQSGTPWLPVAGETFGLVQEFTKLFNRLSTTEKEAMQALNVNVLVTKTGIGNLFVSQNTMIVTTSSLDPLRRSHVVTEALYIKRLLKRVAEQLLFAPNNIKTWNQFSLKAKSLFQKMVDLEGIEQFDIKVGRGITMTETDIAEGRFKAVVNFLPIRVIEQVTFNLVVQETENAFVVSFEGGDL